MHGRSALLPAIRQLAPFAGTALAAWISVLFGADITSPEYGASVALLALSWTYGVRTGIGGNVWRGTVLGSLLFLAALGFLRDAAGGSTSGVALVSLLPVFQTALYVPDRRALWIVLAAVLGFYLAPLVIVGPPAYPVSGYRAALLSVAVSSIVGLVTHGLVANIRHRASEAHRRARMLVRINETVQALYQSDDPRREACRAVKELSGALVAGLYEPDGETQTLRMTTTTETPDTIASGSPASPGSAVDEAFRRAEPLLITEDVERRVGNIELWRADGAPTSLLYQPLLRGTVPVGVLFVGWRDAVAREEPRVVLASLLAREIAGVIDRADIIGQLTDEALTDPLTGLPNRRAWDSRLAQAIEGRREPVAVAMLDIDRFKQFNDLHGHPAGDRLLRETAAAWRSEIRSGDFLARLGGEEFALLLSGGDRETVRTLVERVRRRMPESQTCSAGIAVRRDGDTPEQLLSRADTALYEAKAGGRDRTVFSDPAVHPA